jgi:DNA-binding LacI/PurR family transcriptional regulator
LKAVENAGEKLGVQLVVVPARTVDDLERAFSTMSRERVAGILVVASQPDARPPAFSSIPRATFILHD